MKALDKEISWFIAYGGRKHSPSHVRRGQELVGPFIIEQEGRYGCFVGTFFEGNERVQLQGLPSELRAAVPFEAVKIGGQSRELIFSTSTGDGSPPNYKKLKARLKRLLGRESRAGPRMSRSSGALSRFLVILGFRLQVDLLVLIGLGLLRFCILVASPVDCGINCAFYQF